MVWVILIIAGLFEMFGVLMINNLHQKRNWQSLILLILGFGASFLFLALAMKSLSMEQRMPFGPNRALPGNIRDVVFTVNQKI